MRKKQDTMHQSEKNEAPMSEEVGRENEAPASKEGEKEDTMSKERRLKRSFRIKAVLLAGVFLIVGLTVGLVSGASMVDSRARNLAWLVEVIEDNYYREIDDEDIYNKLYSALELDRFCSYYTVNEYEALVDESRGQNAGYGISILSEGDLPRIYRTVYNSPAELAGLEGGMYVYRFGEGAESLQKGDAEEFYDFLSGHASCCMEFGFEGGEKKIATVTAADYAAAYCEYRDGEGTYRFRGDGGKLSLTRTGEGMSVLGEGEAYIRFTQFDGNAAREFESCLSLMKERGKKDLVLDLRGNGGGYLTTLCTVASHLLRKADGKAPLVATARYRSGRVESYLADKNDFSEYFAEDSVIRVLADENTASASESLIGAMTDYGTIGPENIYLRESVYNGEKVGKTYGKGVMQNTFVAPNGRALRLTVARIFWPKGNSIHEVGVRADAEHTVKADLLASGEEFLSMIGGA